MLHHTSCRICLLAPAIETFFLNIKTNKEQTHISSHFALKQRMMEAFRIKKEVDPLSIDKEDSDSEASVIVDFCPQDVR